MTSDFNIILYGKGLFSRNTSAANHQQLRELQTSGFTTVILWTLHIDEAGNFNYNDTAIVQNAIFTNQFNYLPRLVNELKSADRSKVTKVLFAIGSADVGDFANIQKLLASPAGELALRKNFTALMSALPIDGFDFDLEEEGIAVSTIVKLTTMLARYEMIVTYCPSFDTETEFWIPCLEQVYQQAQKQCVNWFNLQCYSGGGNNQPNNWAKLIDPKTTGISDPVRFVIPGYWCVHSGNGDCNQGDCPIDIQNRFTELATQTDKGICGGFIWNSEDLFACRTSPKCKINPTGPLHAYAMAIYSGLSAGS